MIGIPEIVVVAIGVLISAGLFRRINPSSRRARLSQNALRHWYAHRFEAAIADYEALEKEAQRIKDQSRQDRVSYVAWQALGFIHRGLGRYEHSRRYLDKAITLLDQGLEQPPEWAFLTRIEHALSVAAPRWSAEFPRGEFVTLLCSLERNERSLTIEQAIQYLHGLAGDARVTPCAIEIIRLLEQHASQEIDLGTKTKPATTPPMPTAMQTPSGQERTPLSANAFAAPTSDPTDERQTSSLRMDAKIARATLQSYVADHSAVATTLQRIQADPSWWKLDQQKLTQVNRLLATQELTCGSVKRAVQLRDSEQRNITSQDSRGDTQAPFRIASAKMDYATCLLAYGDYVLACDQAEAAYQIVRNQFRHKTPGEFSPWYPDILALALMEKGDFKRAHPLISEAMNGNFLQSGSFCDAHVKTVHSIYCRMLGRLPQALDSAQDAVSSLETRFGNDAHQTGDYRLTVAAILVQLGERQQAAKELERAKHLILRKIKRNASSNSHLELTSAMVDIAFGKTEQAQQRLGTLRKNLMPLIKPDHATFAAIENMMGDSARVKGDTATALAHYQKGIELGSSWKNRNSPAHRHAIEQLIDGYESIGTPDALPQYQERLLSIIKYADECP